MTHRPYELSGGRAATRRHCARACNKPAIIMADEPTGKSLFKSWRGNHGVVAEFE